MPAAIIREDDVRRWRAGPLREEAAPAAVLAALGIVYGDLGDSRCTLQAVVRRWRHLSPETALGTVSLIFWALIIAISVKYCCSSCVPTIKAKAASWH